jgi:hypothetical protein
MRLPQSAKTRTNAQSNLVSLVFVRSMTGSLPPDEEFHTWSEIAGYLRISVREAQYRAKNEGLPIRRMGGQKPRVWALRSELDAWKTRIGSADSALDRQATAQSKTAQAVAENSPNRQVNRRWVIAGLAGSALAFGGTALLFRPHRSPERAVLTGNLLTALDGLGRTLWTHRFSGTLQQFGDDEMRWRVQVIDFKGDGHPGVVVACSFVPERSTNLSARDELFYFAPDGTVQWTLPCQPDLVDYSGQRFEPDWRYTHVLASPAGNQQVIFASIRHQTRWPGCVQRVDAGGRSRIQFANAGNIECLCRIPRADGDYLAISGENNGFDRACVAVIGVDDPPSCSPAGGPPRYRFANALAGAPRDYILFPTVELTIANSASYGHANRVSYQGGGITVYVDVVGSQTLLLYEFSDRLEPRVAMPSGNYPVVHEQFEERGLLHHPWAACPELAKPLTLRRWEPGIGWRDQDVPWRLPNNLV